MHAEKRLPAVLFWYSLKIVSFFSLFLRSIAFSCFLIVQVFVHLTRRINVDFNFNNSAQNKQKINEDCTIYLMTPFRSWLISPITGFRLTHPLHSNCRVPPALVHWLSASFPNPVDEMNIIHTSHF